MQVTIFLQDGRTYNYQYVVNIYNSKLIAFNEYDVIIIKFKVKDIVFLKDKIKEIKIINKVK